MVLAGALSIFLATTCICPFLSPPDGGRLEGVMWRWLVRSPLLTSYLHIALSSPPPLERGSLFAPHQHAMLVARRRDR